eukprot:8274052-Alexandrium_andersonii.AAC.1
MACVRKSEARSRTSWSPWRSAWRSSPGLPVRGAVNGQLLWAATSLRGMRHSGPQLKRTGLRGVSSRCVAAGHRASPSGGASCCRNRRPVKSEEGLLVGPGRWRTALARPPLLRAAP